MAAPVKRAFTMMELIVAAALFAVSMLVLVGAFPLSAKAVRKAEVRNIATHLAENQLEKSQFQSFVTLANVTPYTVPAELVNNGSVETLQFEVEQQVTNATAGLKRVQVEVRWTRDGQHLSVVLGTDHAYDQP